jgi:hypothetical protein
VQGGSAVLDAASRHRLQHGHDCYSL